MVYAVKVQAAFSSMHYWDGLIVKQNRLGVIKHAFRSKIHCAVLSIHLSDSGTIGDQQACHRFRRGSFRVFVHQIGITLVLADSSGFLG